MEIFDSISLEVYAGGSWVNIYQDVIIDSITGNRGIMDNGPLDRIGDAGYLNFKLKNSNDNAAGLIGYYSPGHANCWSLWRTGLYVRLVFTYDGQPYYKWFGTIMPRGITVSPGIYADRTVTVRCHDYMAQMAEHKVNLLALQVNKTIDEAMPALLANMPHAPLETSFAAGLETFPTVFDGIDRQAITGVLNDLALSEWCYAYVKGDKTGGETLVSEAQNTRPNLTDAYIPLSASQSSILAAEDSDVLTTENDEDILLDELQTAILENYISGSLKVSYGKHQTNRVLGTAYPRKVDAAATTTLFELQSPIKLEPNETKTGIRCTFRDPDGAATRINGTNVTVTPTANTQSDGLGSDVTGDLTWTETIGTDGFEGTAVNGTSSDMYITAITAIGKGIYLYDYVSMVVEDTDSQTTYQTVQTLNFRAKYQNNPALIQLISAYILAQQRDPHTSVDEATFFANRDGLSMMCFLELEPGMKASFTESMTAVDDSYFIMGYSFIIKGCNQVYWTPVLSSDPGYYRFWVWDSTAWGDGAFGFN